jgi:hypothetical protein
VTFLADTAAGDDATAAKRLVAPIALLGLGLAVRLVIFSGAYWIPPLRDEVLYISLGVDWDQLGVYTSGRAPGYAFLIAWFFSVFGARGLIVLKLVQVLASLIVGGTTMALARELFDRRVALAAGFAWAVYLPLAAYTSLLWPETLFLALFLPALWVLVRAVRHPREATAAWMLAGSGALLGLALLLKESVLFLVPLLAVGLLLSSTVSRGRAFARAAVFGLAVVTVVSPWTVRNYDVYERFAPVGSTLGPNAFHGLSARYINWDYLPPLFDEAYPPESLVRRWFMPAREDGWQQVVLPNRVDAARENVRRGLGYMANRPAFFAVSRVKKLADYVNPMSFFTRHIYRDLYAAPLDAPWVRRAIAPLAVLLVVVLILAALGAIVYGPPLGSGAWPVWLTLAYLPVTGLLISSSRLRIPIVPLLLILAAAFLSRASGIRRAARRRHVCAIAAIILLVFLWSLNGAGVAAQLAGIWSSPGVVP